MEEANGGPGGNSTASETKTTVADAGSPSESKEEKKSVAATKSAVSKSAVSGAARRVAPSSEPKGSAASPARKSLQPAAPKPVQASLSSKSTSSPSAPAVSSKIKSLSTSTSTSSKLPDSAATKRLSVTSPTTATKPLQTKPTPVRATALSPSPSISSTKARAPAVPGTTKGPLTSTSRSFQPNRNIPTGSIQKVTASTPKPKTTDSVVASEDSKPDKVGTDGAEDAEKLVRLELQIAELQTRLTTVLEESEANSRTLKHELEDAHLQHNVAIEEKNNLSLQIAQLSGELDSLRSELSNRQHTVAEFESQMASLSAASQSDSTAARNRILEVEEVLSKVSEENSTISKLLEDSKRSLMTSENERILWDEERVKLLRAAADTEASFAEATKELENARSLIADLKSKGETNSSLQADYQSLKADRDSHLQRASELEVEILELKEDLENLQESLLTKTDSARHAQEELESRIKLHDESVATSLAKVGELSSMLAQEKALHAKDLNESKSELESIAKQLRDMEQRVVDVEKDKELAQQKLSELALSHEASSAGTQQRHSEEMAEIRAREQLLEAETRSRIAQIEAQQERLLREARDAAKGEAGGEHGKELQALRAQSQSSMQDLRAAHERALLDARQSHQTEVDRLVQDYEKKLSNQNLDLKATKDDLVKAKSALPLVQGELELLKAELLKAQEAVKTASADDAASKQVLLLSEELEKTKKALQGLQSTHDTCKGQLASLTDRHAQELEQSVLNHVSTLSKLDQEYASEKEDLLRQISSLQQRNGELEVEVAALASEKAETHDPPSPTLPQVNGNVTNAAIITREELSRMHEAHNLKIHEIEASYKKQVSELEAAVAAAVKHAEESEMTAERTGMENHFLRSEGEEYADRIKRLEEEVVNLRKLSAD